MKLYNQNIDKVEECKVIEGSNGETIYANKVSAEVLASLGFFHLQYEPYPNRRYYKAASETRTVIDNKFVIGYVTEDRPLDEIKQAMLADLKETFVNFSKRPVVDTGLGFSVDGGYFDKINFEIGKKKGLPMIKGADNLWYDVVDADYDTIINAIEDYGILLWQTKNAKEQEIANLTTVADCVLYESTPYEAIEDVLDEVTLQPIGETKVVTKYKNNVKEWF